MRQPGSYRVCFCGGFGVRSSVGQWGSNSLALIKPTLRLRLGGGVLGKTWCRRMPETHRSVLDLRNVTQHLHLLHCFGTAMRVERSAATWTVPMQQSC